MELPSLGMTQYSYAKLAEDRHEIRLLTVNPSDNFFSDIYCTLDVIDLERKPAYSALSYTWGEQEASKAFIIINRKFEMKVTENLRLALQYMRDDRWAMSLWIDAICIDQDNLIERSAQVGIMRDIYMGADKVYAWLGVPDEDMSLALTTCQAVSEEKRLELETMYDPKVINDIAIHAKEARHDQAPRGSKKYEMLLKAFSKIFNTPYWSRIWTFQELIVATNDPVMVCGNFRVSMKELHPATMGVLSASPTDTFWNLDQWQRYRGGWWASRKEESQTQPTLTDMMVQTSSRFASDPRDCIYAILGLLPEFETSITADYTRATSLVFQDAMMHLFQGFRTLSPLACAIQKKTAALPSWCIDFSMPWWDAEKMEGDAGTGSTSRKWKHRPAVSLEASEGLLTLKGVHVGTAVSTSTPNIGDSGSITDSTLAESVNGIYDGLQDMMEGANIDVEDIIWKMMMDNHGLQGPIHTAINSEFTSKLGPCVHRARKPWETRPLPRCNSLCKDAASRTLAILRRKHTPNLSYLNVLRWRPLTSADLNFAPEWFVRSINNSYERFLLSITTNIRGRTFIRLSNDYLARSFENIEDGDIIVAFPHSAFVFALRRQAAHSQAQEIYQLIGLVESLEIKDLLLSDHDRALRRITPEAVAIEDSQAEIDDMLAANLVTWRKLIQQGFTAADAKQTLIDKWHKVRPLPADISEALKRAPIPNLSDENADAEERVRYAKLKGVQGAYEREFTLC